MCLPAMNIRQRAIKALRFALELLCYLAVDVKNSAEMCFYFSIFVVV